MSKHEEKKTEARKDGNYDIAYDNLAMPEIRTGRAERKGEETPNQESVTYDTLAVPEIHVRKKKQP